MEVNDSIEIVQEQASVNSFSQAAQARSASNSSLMLVSAIIITTNWKLI